MLTKEQKQRAFEKWWNDLPQKQVKEKKEAIMSKCFITRYVFIFWLTGKTEIPNLAMPVIENIAGEKIFESID